MHTIKDNPSLIILNVSAVIVQWNKASIVKLSLNGTLKRLNLEVDTSPEGSSETGKPGGDHMKMKKQSEFLGHYMEGLEDQQFTGEQSGEKLDKTAVITHQPDVIVEYKEEKKDAIHQQHAQKPKRLNFERKLYHRGKVQRRSAQEAIVAERAKQSDAPGSSNDANTRQATELSPASSSSAVSAVPSCSMDTLRQKRERKLQKPGKYVCSYCGRACAKPSVLQKHIRSHTGERPYPCAPCGFSFKTKSNLYKHRKSHTHRVKAGLAVDMERPGISCSEEPPTESDEETISLEKQRLFVPTANASEKIPKVMLHDLEDSQAVKRRLALRLSRGRQTPLGSSDETSSSFGLSSKGSTESGYFSRSESTEVTQDTPPNTSAKSYAEVILGKFGRIGHFQRISHTQHDNLVGQEASRIQFNVPKKQVIDHITKLITINEAVVDTSKIDSVKPRRFSLSRRSSTDLKHTSSFEKHESSLKTPGPDEIGHTHDVSHSSPHRHQASKPIFRKLIRQHNVQVPEILVTEDSNTETMAISPPPTLPITKDNEKVTEFQWPQRSQSLAQVPIEKLPPKKKRLRLAEAAQSSEDSSFESMSLPQSPSQDSCVSHTSFEESHKAEADVVPTRRSRATYTLTVPTNSPREMRRSASEQAPHVPQLVNLISETRSKSFDYSSLSPDRTPAGWRERRKCLLMRHSAVTDNEDDDQSSKVGKTGSPSRQTCSSPTYSPAIHYTPTTQVVSSCNIVHSFDGKQISQSENALSENSQQYSMQLNMQLLRTDQPTTVGSLFYPSGAARAHYSSVSTGLKLEIPPELDFVDSGSRVNEPYLTRYRQHHNLAFGVSSHPEKLASLQPQRIPVRLNSELSYNPASIYTTVSQRVVSRPQDVCCIPCEPNSLSTGATKRVLSPTSSEELNSEFEQQQKRVHATKPTEPKEAELTEVEKEREEEKEDQLSTSELCSRVQICEGG
ncbi:hypothetical protein DNTS_001912 [Danionella cerebrum]|uniref:C2H2-type domain-containing protein n=1 Tax=Danionella cerebrum TaxID=2873325 RepID=A0A553QMD6_9TELE|nr:hypothetical protein DNTS_001912 [Danionella translucida]